jgi:hypothetical protein
LGETYCRLENLVGHSEYLCGRTPQALERSTGCFLRVQVQVASWRGILVSEGTGMNKIKILLHILKVQRGYSWHQIKMAWHVATVLDEIEKEKSK